MFDTKTLTVTSPAAPGTVAGGTFGPDPAAAVYVDLSKYEHLMITLKLQGATGGTLDVYLQFFDGTDWVDWAHLAQLAAAAASISYVIIPPMPTTKDATVQGGITTIGRNLSPVLAAAQCIGNHPGDRLRVLFVAGAGTSAGAAQTIAVTAVQSNPPRG